MSRHHAWTPDALLEHFRNPRNEGFTAASCSACEKTANIPGGLPGWRCSCGSYELHGFDHFTVPHNAPNLGPTHAAILGAVAQVRAEATC